MPLPGTPEEAIAFLESLAPSGVRLGLDRIHTALHALGNPEQQYPVVHVAGTNGKGSTCAFVASCLGAHGHKVGLYTSPHLEKVNERIRINGEDISDALLGQRITEVLARYPDAAASPPPLTYFEFGTVVALWHFAQTGVDVAVLETGLGGRLDATTAARPVVTAITPIGFDHMAYLGDTLGAIAREKAGIIKPRVPVVCSRQSPEALDVLVQVARDNAAPLFLEGRDFHLEAGPGQPEGRTFTYRGLRMTVPDLRLSLRGAHQTQNAAVALACVELLADRALPSSPQSVSAGLAAARWPGRLESFAGHPEVILDGAHNAAGAEALARALDDLYPDREVHLVFGVLEDKDYRPILQTLLPRCTTVHLTPVPTPRTLLPERYLAQAQALCAHVQAYAAPAEALAGARSAAERGQGLVVGSGSLFLVGALRTLLRSTTSSPPLPAGQGRT